MTAPIGDTVAELLCGGASWVQRRDMRIEYVDDVTARFRLRVDCRPGENRTPTAWRPDGTPLVHAPLFVLRKRVPLVDIEFTDSRGRLVSFPTPGSKKDVAEAALLALAGRLLHGAPLPEALQGQIRAVARTLPPDSVDACDALLRRDEEPSSGARARLADDEDFRFLARLVSWNWLIVLPVPARSEGALYTLEYTDVINEWTPAWGGVAGVLGGMVHTMHMRGGVLDRLLTPAVGLARRLWDKVPTTALSKIALGLRPLPLRVDIPFVGAQSFHAETYAPRGMCLGPGLLAARVPGQHPAVDQAKPSGRNIHLHIEDAERCRSGLAALELRTRRSGLIDAACVACGLVALMLIASFCLAGNLALSNNTGPTLLLALPGLLATYALRPVDHELTHAVLRGTRLLLYACAFAAYLAAFWLVVAPSHTTDPPVVASEAPAAAVCATTPQLPFMQPTADTCPHGMLLVNAPPADVVLVSPVHPATASLQLVWGALALLAVVATVVALLARRSADA